MTTRNQPTLPVVIPASMTIEDRVERIVDQVLARRPGARHLAVGVERISDDPRWYALFTPAQLPDQIATGGGGPAWDLVQVFAYDQVRLSAHIRNGDLRPQLYLPGPWEAIFIPLAITPIPPLLPGGHPQGSLSG